MILQYFAYIIKLKNSKKLSRSEDIWRGRYIKNKKNPENAEYTHPSLIPILNVTYGCMVYQEQVMQIVRDLAGYSLGRADLVRRAMGKKKLDVMAKEREYFIHGQTDE